MLNCEGYKMFYGSALVTPRNDTIQPFRISGTWLYKPDTGCWYVEGRSFPARIVEDIHDRTAVYEDVLDIEKPTYFYGMRLRGFSPGAQPKGGFIGTAQEKPGAWKTSDGREYHDILRYDRQLTDRELAEYELDYLGEE